MLAFMVFGQRRPRGSQAGREMHIFFICAAAIGIALTSTVGAAEPRTNSAESTTPWNERPWSLRASILRAVRGSRIVRRDAPARSTNIVDQEILEIEAVMREQHPGAVVNIGTVVNDCPCEDGPSCTEQVWVVAYLPHASQGLQLSRVNGRWQIGPLQQWWLRFEAFNQKPYPQGRIGDPALTAKVDTYVQEQTALYDSFPLCTHPESSSAKENAG